jgi:ribosome-binding protein aMBF1 (putative translation factor)
MDSPVNHQDREVIVIRKKLSATEERRNEMAGTKKSVAGNKPEQPEASHLRKLEQNAEAGIVSLPKVPLSFRIEMQRARSKLGWTQQDLARRLNVPVDTVKKYENGSIVPSGAVVSNIKKMLGIVGDHKRK